MYRETFLFIHFFNGVSVLKIHLVRYIVANIFNISNNELCKYYYYFVYCFESFAHIECYSDSSCRGRHLVEPLCFGVVYCV